MSQFIKLSVLAVASLSSFFIGNTYASNEELAQLRHSHAKHFRQRF